MEDGLQGSKRSTRTDCVQNGWTALGMGGLHSEGYELAFVAWTVWSSHAGLQLGAMDCNQAQSSVVNGLHWCTLDCASCSPDKNWTAATRQAGGRVALSFVRLLDELGASCQVGWRTLDCRRCSPMLNKWTALAYSASLDCTARSPGTSWTATYLTSWLDELQLAELLS